MPLLEGLQRKLGTDKMRIIVVNTREEGTLRQTRRTYKKLVKQFENKGLQLEFVFDKKHALYNTLNKPGLPYTMVIDKQGKITYAQAGYSEQIAQPMLAAIQAVLSDSSTAKH
ncbi:TlpA family protein disulfide reductase [Pseudoalteromonas sp. SMS1]|nr:TlpA family protein disulfide reductase [Pseudoalteromonas sp. SMS1]